MSRRAFAFWMLLHFALALALLYGIKTIDARAAGDIAAGMARHGAGR